MPIVSSEIIKTRDRKTPSHPLWVREAHTDHTGKVYGHDYYCPVDHDINQEMLDYIPKLEAMLIEAEKNEVQVAIENGADPDEITPKHMTNAEKADRAVMALMQGDSKKILKSAQYVKRLSDAQIRSLFYDTSQITKIRKRQDYVINNQALFADDIREKR